MQASGLKPEAVQAIQGYLLAVNEAATKAQSDAKRGMQLSLATVGNRKLDKADIYKMALPPLPKLQARTSHRADAGASQQAPTVASLPAQPSEVV